MKTVAFSKDRVDAGEIERHVAHDRKEHMQRGYFAVVWRDDAGRYCRMARRGVGSFRSLRAQASPSLPQQSLRRSSTLITTLPVRE